MSITTNIYPFQITYVLCTAVVPRRGAKPRANTRHIAQIGLKRSKMACIEFYFKTLVSWATPRRSFNLEAIRALQRHPREWQFLSPYILILPLKSPFFRLTHRYHSGITQTTAQTGVPPLTSSLQHPPLEWRKRNPPKNIFLNSFSKTMPAQQKNSFISNIWDLSVKSHKKRVPKVFI